MKKIAILAVIAFIGTNVYAADQKALPTPVKQKTSATTPSKSVAKAAISEAKPAVAVVTAAPTAATPPKALTKSEMILRVNEILTNRPNIAPLIQGLESVKQENGTSFYLYNKKKLEELDEETLLKLLSLINQQLSIENMQQFDRQQRQLRNLRQIEQLNRTQRMLKQNSTPKTPKVYTPPKVPKTYR